MHSRRRLLARAGTVLATATLPLVAALPGAAHVELPRHSGVLSPAYQRMFTDATRTCPHLTPGLLPALVKVESGFDPDTIGPDGQRGLVQLSPRMWSSWGRDADGDGTNSALDSADAIDTAARMMCHLYRQAADSTLPGDRISLALAGYRLGWSRVAEVGGLADLPGTRAYITRIKGYRARYATQHGGGFGDGAGVRLGSSSMPVGNPRGVADALAWSRQARYGDDRWYRLCLQFMARSYGWAHSGTEYAIDHFLDVVPSWMRHYRDRDVPAGALMFWDTGECAGHVALSLGDGYIATNDVYRSGGISVVPASTIEQQWGARYLGWTAPYFPAGVNY